MRTRSFFALAALLVLAGCGGSTPLPNTYILSAPVAPVTGVRDDRGRPIVVVPTVALPDYLDSTDLLLRDGRNQLRASQTGRWGERLSLGITHALTADLGRLLPGDLVTHAPLSDQPARTVLVNVEAFDVHPNGECVLTARWAVPGDTAQPSPLNQQGSFVTRARLATGPSGTPSPSDSDVVAAMATAVEQLAGRIAIGLRRVQVEHRGEAAPEPSPRKVRPAERPGSPR